MKEKVSILIVDDETNMRITLSDILEDEGYKVSTAADGIEALDLCKSSIYDVILMDIRMPGLNGVEAFYQIRQLQQGVRVIMMSAHSVDELKKAALKGGAIAFLPKPLEIESTLKLIEEAKITTILMVAADEKVSKPAQEALKKHGYRTRFVKSATEALELIEQINFDIIFIDVQLPLMNGLELYLAIKKVTPTTVAIMISGREEEFKMIAKEAVKRTAYAIVKKPLDIDELLGLLRRLGPQLVSDNIEKPDPEG